MLGLLKIELIWIKLTLKKDVPHEPVVFMKKSRVPLKVIQRSAGNHPLLSAIGKKGDIIIKWGK